MKGLITFKTNKLMASLHAKANNMNEELFDMVSIEATLIMEESKQEVPVDTACLQSIADVVIIRPTQYKGIIRIGYGLNGDVYNEKSGQWASQYAMRVHEDLSMHHTNGKAKFFEDPVNRGRVRLKERSLGIVRRNWK